MCSGSNASNGAIINGKSVGVRPDGSTITGNFDQSPRGTKVLSWKGPLTLVDLTDGTSNTVIIGEKFIRMASREGKNEDRSIFASDNQNNHRRLLGVNPDNSDSRTLVSDINATLNTWPLCNSSFGGPHPGVCMFAMGDGSIKPIKTSVDVTNLTRLAMRSDGQVITAGLD